MKQRIATIRNNITEASYDQVKTRHWVMIAAGLVCCFTLFNLKHAFQFGAGSVVETSNTAVVAAAVNLPVEKKQNVRVEIPPLVEGDDTAKQVVGDDKKGVTSSRPKTEKQDANTPLDNNNNNNKSPKPDPTPTEAEEKKPQDENKTKDDVVKDNTKPRPKKLSSIPKRFKRPKGISPADSIAPQAMKLFDTENPGIHKRHECLVKIRESAHQALDPYVQSYAQSQRSVLVVDPAFHVNVGDSLIYQGELGFLKALGYESPSLVEHCGYWQSGPFAKVKCKDYLQSDTVGNTFAYWQGGGNWGDLWHKCQAQRIPSFELLLKKNYTIVAMPSSFHYVSDKVREKDTADMKRYIASGLGREDLDNESAMKEAASRTVFTWREIKSLEDATKEYPFATNLLVPDMAFHLGPYEPRQTTQKEDLELDILFFLRDDKESVISSTRNDAAITKLLSTVEGGSDLKFGIVDWNSRFALWPSEDQLFTESAIQLMSLGKVVICDRLHASILCYLTGIPFVYIDQRTGKISKTLGVAFDSWEGCKDGETAMWARAYSMQEAVETAVGFMKKYNL